MLQQELLLKSPKCVYLGESPWDPALHRAAGLYTQDTRFLNVVSASLNGQTPELLHTRNDRAGAATVMSVNPELRLKDGTLIAASQISIEQRLELDDSLRIHWTLRNYAQRALSLTFGLRFAADFRDVFEVRGMNREHFGTLLPPRTGPGSLELRYRATDGKVISTRVSFDREYALLAGDVPGDTPLRSIEETKDIPSYEASFPVELAPGGSWELTVTVNPQPPHTQPVENVPAHGEISASIVTDNPWLNRLLERGQDNLVALESSFPHGMLPAAGIPWFVAPFGRDSLITGLQTMHLAPHNAEGTLRVLAALQGAKTDLFTEEEPGKILHEMRYGEMARSGEIPHQPYFGSVDSTPLFVLLFADVVAWTADRQLYADLLPNVRAALDWIEQYGDTDGDGLIDYDADVPVGIRIRHRVWKDSVDSLTHVDGREATGRIAPVEVQGYTLAAYRRLAVVAAAHGDLDLATELTAKAERLSAIIEHVFWMEEEQFYAQGLDNGVQVRAIASNPGHLLMTGALPRRRSAAVIRRLRQPDMDSGWGIRTLSAESPNYNPASYHNGSVWPHDNSLIAAGCYQTGDAEAGNAIFAAMFDAAQTSTDSRLNELYCGFGRQDVASVAPVPYPTACSPQAWAAGTLPYLVRLSLGLSVDVPGNVLRVAPALPDFLNEVTISGLTVFGQTGKLTVRRSTHGYEIETDTLPIQVVDGATE